MSDGIDFGRLYNALRALSASDIPKVDGYSPPRALWNDARIHGGMDILLSPFIERDTMLVIGPHGATKVVLGTCPKRGMPHEVSGLASEPEGGPTSWTLFTRAYLISHGGDRSEWLDAPTGRQRVFYTREGWQAVPIREV